MADNVAITAGSGTTVATDERTIAATAVQVQRVDEQGSTAIAAGQVSCSTTATSIAAARDTRKAIVIVNRGTNALYVGPSGVTTTTGFQLNQNDAITIRTTAQVFGIVATATSTAHFVEEYDV